MITTVSLLHMGKLHAYEHLLVYLLAFGPFVLLALTIWTSRRRTGESRPDERADHTADLPADPRH